DKGTVQRIVNGIMSEEPLLDVNVANDRGKYGHQEERGLLGMAIEEDSEKSSQNSASTYVFLYYTEAKGEDGGEPLGNRLLRYELVDKTLTPARQEVSVDGYVYLLELREYNTTYLLLCQLVVEWIIS
ncbi:MAG: hypothetical protein ACR2IS_01440, partial [Nitrososphaeraceae archaeon]